MILDEIRALANQLGVREFDPPPFTSQASNLLAVIEQQLGIDPPKGATVGARLAIAKAKGPTMLKPGDRVEIDTPVLYRGQHGTLIRTTTSRIPTAVVKLDGSPYERSFYLSNLKKLETNMTIASRIKDALAGKLSNTKPTNIRAAIMQLAAAGAACTIANGAKDKAKKALVDLGIADAEYREGTVTIFDDTEFKVEAVTKAPSERLDQAMLKAALQREGLSTAKINRAFAAATVPNKPATSFVVTEK